MFGKKLVSDALLAAVKEVTSGEQIDSSGSALSVGDAVRVQEGPHAGKTGTISGFQNTGRSEVQINHGPSVAIYNDTLLNEGGMSPAEITRRRKEQKRELVRGNRKSGKLSDKLYDYELRKSQGKPVNVPKNPNNEEIDPFTGQPIDEKLTDSQRNAREKSRTRTHGGEGMTKTKDDFGQTTTDRGQMSASAFAKRLARDKKQQQNNEEYDELVLDHRLLDSLLAEAGFDAVDKKALKKKWKDREDQDIDNDGDEDESDRYLHKRRKAISTKKGEKVEINPEIKETIRKLIHSTLK